MDEYSPGASGHRAEGVGAEQDGGVERGEDEFSAIVPRIFMLADSIERGGPRSRNPDVQEFMTEQNRNYVKKEIGKLLSDIWRIKGLAEQEYGSQHPITKKLSRMHTDAQELLQEKSGSRSQ